MPDSLLPAPGVMAPAPGWLLHRGDVLDAYAGWPEPTAIISDGPYGISGYPGDPPRPEALPALYEPHAAAWAAAASAQTTLWFWCTEVGWALSHPVLARHGWIYRGCNIWDKGVAHIAGNCNGRTMRRFPTVTEVCAHYVREPLFTVSGMPQSLQDWFRAEWRRTGLPMSRANDACGVRNAASRKYLASDHHWYAPPPEVFSRLARYANQHGDAAGRPYFALTAEEMASDTLAASKWLKLQAKFRFEYGVTNVWACAANRGGERLKQGGRAVHGNQKPTLLMERIIRASTDQGDMVWDAFGGTGAGALAALRLGRRVCIAECNPQYHDLLAARLAAAP